jgi:hypothetical protein
MAGLAVADKLARLSFQLFIAIVVQAASSKLFIAIVQAANQRLDDTSATNNVDLIRRNVQILLWVVGLSDISTNQALKHIGVFRLSREVW